MLPALESQGFRVGVYHLGWAHSLVPAMDDGALLVTHSIMGAKKNTPIACRAAQRRDCC